MSAWVTSCLPECVSVTSGLPQVAADLLQRHSCPPWGHLRTAESASERCRAFNECGLQLWICGKTEFDRQGRCPAGIDLPPQDRVPQALGL